MKVYDNYCSTRDNTALRHAFQLFPSAKISLPSIERFKRCIMKNLKNRMVICLGTCEEITDIFRFNKNLIKIKYDYKVF